MELQRQYQSEALRQGIQPDTAQAFTLQRSLAMPILRAAPAEFVFIHLKDSLVTLFPASPEILEVLGITKGGSGTLSVFQKQGLIAGARHYFRGNLLVVFLMVPELLLMACSYGGFVVWAWGEPGHRAAMRPSVILIVLIISTFVFVGGAGSVPRYRLPVEALINCVAGAGIVRILSRPGNPQDQSTTAFTMPASRCSHAGKRSCITLRGAHSVGQAVTFTCPLSIRSSTR